jgi:hypothetical protein
MPRKHKPKRWSRSGWMREFQRVRNRNRHLWSVKHSDGDIRAVLRSDHTVKLTSRSPGKISRLIDAYEKKDRRKQEGGMNAQEEPPQETKIRMGARTEHAPRVLSPGLGNPGTEPFRAGRSAC